MYQLLHVYMNINTVQFSLMFSLNSAKTFVIAVKGFKPATSGARDQDATTAPARHM